MHEGLQTAFMVQPRLPGTGKSPAGSKLTELASCHPSSIHCAGAGEGEQDAHNVLASEPKPWGPRWLRGGGLHPAFPPGCPDPLLSCTHARWSPQGTRRTSTGQWGGQQETKAGRKELSPCLLLTQGWHSSFDSWVPRRPGVSWRYTLLGLASNSYRPKEKRAGQKRKILPEHGGKKRLNFILRHSGGRLWILLLLNERTHTQKYRDLALSKWFGMRPMVRAMVAAVSRTAEINTWLLVKVIESNGWFTSITLGTLQIHFLKNYLLCLTFSVKYTSSLWSISADRQTDKPLHKQLPCFSPLH